MGKKILAVLVTVALFATGAFTVITSAANGGLKVTGVGIFDQSPNKGIHTFNENAKLIQVTFNQDFWPQETQNYVELDAKINIYMKINGKTPSQWVGSYGGPTWGCVTAHVRKNATLGQYLEINLTGVEGLPSESADSTIEFLAGFADALTMGIRYRYTGGHNVPYTPEEAEVTGVGIFDQIPNKGIHTFNADAKLIQVKFNNDFWPSSTQNYVELDPRINLYLKINGKTPSQWVGEFGGPTWGCITAHVKRNATLGQYLEINLKGTEGLPSEATNSTIEFLPGFADILTTGFTYTYEAGNNIPYSKPVSTEQPVITLSKTDVNVFAVNISNWYPSYTYQIWTYQQVTSGIFETQEELQNQWILSKPYTLGSNRDVVPDPDFNGRTKGFVLVGNLLQSSIGTFASVDQNYTVAVKVLNEEGSFVGQYKTTFTEAEAGVAGISKVTVDEDFADDKAFVKNISVDSPVKFVVTGNGAQGLTYSAKVDHTDITLSTNETIPNEFSWDISSMKPGDYSVTLTAATTTSSDSRKVNFRLYDSTVLADAYGVIGGAVSTVPGTETDTHYAINIGAAGITGAWFRYRISEPWGPTVRFSDPIDASGGSINASDSNSILKGKYGIYQVTGYTYRNNVTSADDGFVKTVNYSRPGGVALNVTVSGDAVGAEIITKNTDSDIIISADSTGIPNPVYSFWRRDANGWVMIRGYEATSAVTWKPHRVGLYTIQVRAKETGGLTYEVLKNIEFNIIQVGGNEISEVTDITVNQAELDADATARTPILITANATSTSEDLLYKFIISNGYIYYVETVYSADSTYMWVPGKAGDYTISVLVKNQVSFGKYDAVQSFTVTVQNIT